MLSVPQGLEAPFSLLCSDSSVSTPNLGDEAAQYLPSQRGLPRSLASLACSYWLFSAVPPFPSWFMESSALKWLAAPHPPGLAEPPVQGIAEARRAGEGPRSWGHALVSPLLLDQQAARASQRREDSANDCLLGEGVDRD